jgi:hypothetical protein
VAPPPGASQAPPAPASGQPGPAGSPAPGAEPFPPAATPPPGDANLLVGQPPPPAHKSKVPVIIGAAATGALAAGAIGFMLSSNNLYSELQSTCGVTAMGCSQSQVDGVKTRDHAATAFWIAAGAAAVATSILLVLRF